jgi:host factor-I protein
VSSLLSCFRGKIGEFMAKKKTLNLQDAFLNSLRTKQQKVNLLLLSGDKVTGIILGFDNFIVVVRDEAKDTLIYKHSISAVIPENKFSLF